MDSRGLYKENYGVTWGGNIKLQDTTYLDSYGVRPDIDSLKTISDVRDTYCHQETGTVSGSSK